MVFLCSRPAPKLRVSCTLTTLYLLPADLSKRKLVRRLPSFDIGIR